MALVAEVREMFAHAVRSVAMEMIELMGHEQPDQIAQAVAMDLVAGLVGRARGMRIRYIHLGAAKPHAGGMVMAHETVQPMMWMVECAAEVE
jgi:uncharacterized protein (DUF697 family)